MGAVAKWCNSPFTYFWILQQALFCYEDLVQKILRIKGNVFLYFSCKIRRIGL